ncbi:hypothetical protein lerEdw1_003069 [Lerista edwardsae]|nr:hypothetical protein lerEdw1_003069 [Lerista edwardsae]
MQLAGRLALSAAALLLLTLAYRYYKARGAAGAQGGEGAADAPGQEAGPREELAGEGAGRAGAPQGPRHRRASSKGGTPNGRETPPALHWDGPAALGRVRREGAPAGRERSIPREEEEEEGQAKKETTRPEARLQPDRKRSVPEEEEEGGERLACTLSDRDQDGSPGARPRAGPTSTDQPSHSHSGHSADSSPESPGQKVAPARGGPALAPPGQEAGPAPPPASGDGATLGGGKGQVPGEALLPLRETLAGQEGGPVFQAAANVDLTITQEDVGGSRTRHSLSSVAEVQVGESLIRRAKQDSDGPTESPARGLRGKVYDYRVQSVSRSVRTEQPSHPSLGPGASGSRATASSPDNCAVQPLPKPAHNSATGEKNGAAPKDPPLPPPGAPVPQEDGKHPLPAGRKEAAHEPPAAQKPPAAGRSVSRKESFHEIVENPELQVQMEGFGSLAPGPPRSCEAPPLGHRPGSVTSLVGSMQGLQAGTSEQPTVEFVAGAKFFHVPQSPEASVAVHLDLGNCYEALCLAKKQGLEGLREAALKVMSDNYLQVLRTNTIYGRLHARERELILEGRMRGRKYVTVADVSSPDQPASRLCYYDDQEDAWHPLAHMPAEAVSQGCAVCSMFNYLFVVAGCEGRGKLRKPSNRVFCYNPLTHIWRELCPLNQARPQCKLVALDGHLYAIGGECLYTVERYDPRLDRWTFTAPLPNDTFAVAHTATACDGEIYVTGGTLRYMLLKYVGRTDTWKVTLTGGTKDRTTEMVTTNGFIYRFDLNRRMGISVYRCSSKAKLWYECATHPMPYPACFQCTVVDNLVYCISRQFNLRFLADYVSPRFGAKELQNFPSPRGTLFPVTLVLPDREAAQTRV